MSAARWLVTGVVLTAFLGCGGGEKPGGASSPAADSASASESGEAESSDQAEGEGEEIAEAGEHAREQAQQIFSGRCFTCHGMQGQGDGPGSAALMPKPRNFTDASWQTSVTDDHLAKIIQYGGAAVGKSPTMPGNPDLMSKPEVVQALVAHIRSLSAPQ